MESTVPALSLLVCESNVEIFFPEIPFPHKGGPAHIFSKLSTLLPQSIKNLVCKNQKCR